MGLDMYLDRWPKLGMNPKTMSAIEEMWEWKDKGKDKEHTLEQWCGVSESELPIKEVIDLCEMFKHETYAAWDDGKRYPNSYMHDQVGYWRKANAVHKWIEDHVVNRDGDTGRELQNCEYYPLYEEDIIALRNDCAYIMDNVKLVPGKLENGERLVDGKWEKLYVDGLVVDNPEICEETMPTQSGFFFGSTGYNEWYIEDVRYTLALCEKILAETDFSRYELTYLASW